MCAQGHIRCLPLDAGNSSRVHPPAAQCSSPCQGAPSSSNSSGLGDALGREGELPAEGTPQLLMAAQYGGSRSRVEEVAPESMDRIRLSRDSHMKFKSLLGPEVSSMAPAADCLRRVA